MKLISFARGAAGAALLALAAAPAAAQSVFASRGLGYPIEPLDARSRALGGVTTGLAEPTPSLVNPASVAGLQAYAFVVALQPDRYDATIGGSLESKGSTVRFPLLTAAIPVTSKLTLQVGYGAYLDQHWQVVQSDSIDLSTGRVGVEDRFASAGGVARFQGGAGYQLTDRLALGVSVDAFTGAAHDTAVRTISGFLPATSEVTYTYSGLGLGLGARYQPTDRTSLSAAVHGGGRIRAESDSAGAETKEYTNPLSVDAGASARLGSTMTVVASGRWAGWSSVDDELATGSGGARDAMGASAGVEYVGFSFFRKPLPLRLGGRYAQLPFRWQGAAEFPNERAVTGGLGLSFSGGAALIDASAERGWRGGASAGVDEPYWRFSFSLRILGR